MFNPLASNRLERAILRRIARLPIPAWIKARAFIAAEFLFGLGIFND